MDKKKVVITLVCILCVLVGFVSVLGVNFIIRNDAVTTDLNEYSESDKSSQNADDKGVGDSQKSTSDKNSAGKYYVQPSGEVWNLKLVNNRNIMTQSEADALPIAPFRDNQNCDSRIQNQLDAMLNDGSEYGLWVQSSYRSYTTQQGLFENKITRVMNERGCSREEAEPIAASEVARPGSSEHNTGLAVDLLNKDCYELEVHWENTPAFTWLQQHCADYGFILRYPKGKEHITGITFEPWHYRYVGVEAAKEIMSKGLCLEEYLEIHGK